MHIASKVPLLLRGTDTYGKMQLAHRENDRRFDG